MQNKHFHHKSLSWSRPMPAPIGNWWYFIHQHWFLLALGKWHLLILEPKQNKNDNCQQKLPFFWTGMLQTLRKSNICILGHKTADLNFSTTSLCLWKCGRCHISSNLVRKRCLWARAVHCALHRLHNVDKHISQCLFIGHQPCVYMRTYCRLEA